MSTLGICAAYVDGPEPEKLFELRAKTDRELLDFVHSKLDFGLSFAVLADVEESAGDREYAEHSVHEAGKALAEAQQLLPLLNEAQRLELNPELNELLEALNRLEWHRELPRSRAVSTF